MQGISRAPHSPGSSSTAMVMPEAIAYPTDSILRERSRARLVKMARQLRLSIVTTWKEGLVLGSRSMPGNPFDGHTLDEALEQAEILSEVKPTVAIVDRGYRGAETDGVTIWRSGQKRGVTRAIKAVIHRRSAIEQTIGHMKTEGKLDRNWLKGALGDAVHAVLCGAGHNLRLLMNKVRSVTQNLASC